MQGLIGKKLGMTTIFDDSGNTIDVTVIEAGPCYVTQIKSKESDGYDAVQLGFGEAKEKKVTKPLAGHFKKAGVKSLSILREFRDFKIEAPVKIGTEIKADIFLAGQLVKVTGVSKGIGFTGVVKRHGFAGGPKSHGQSDRMRAPGSLGQSSWPSRVYKGLRMAGRKGGEFVTVRNLEIAKVDGVKNLIFIKGAVPGASNGIVIVRN